MEFGEDNVGGDSMDLNRVKEILTSQQEFAVHNQGVPVWIEGVNDTSNMVVVSERAIDGEKQLISSDALDEDGLLSYN